MADEAKAQVLLKDFPNIFSLKGKVAVISGGSRGLGLHAASGLMQFGCSKIFITSRKAKACEEACAALNSLPNKAPGAIAISVPADSSKISEIEKLVAEVKKHTDHVDILFANAGATWGSTFDKHPEDAFSKVMDLNVKSVFYTIQKYVYIPFLQCYMQAHKSRFAPLLEAKATKEDPSRVLVTGSVAGIAIGSVLNPQSTYSYSASKAAVLHLARNLAVELGPSNILVNGIAPGFFPSKMASGIIASVGGEAELSKKNPNGRLGRPEDIAGVVVFLCSRAAGHVNGDTVVVDGGKMIAGEFVMMLSMGNC